MSRNTNTSANLGTDYTIGFFTWSILSIIFTPIIYYTGNTGEEAITFAASCLQGGLISLGIVLGVCVCGHLLD